MGRKMQRRCLKALLMLIVVFVLTEAVTLGCPTCKDGMSENPNVARGYFWSILFMMSMPFLLFGSFTMYMYLEIRRARRENVMNDAPPDEVTGPHVTSVQRAARVGVGV